MNKTEVKWFVKPNNSPTNSIIASLLQEEVAGHRFGEKESTDEPLPVWELRRFSDVKTLFLNERELNLKFTIFIQHGGGELQNIHNFAKYIVFRRKTKKTITTTPTTPPPPDQAAF